MAAARSLRHLLEDAFGSLESGLPSQSSDKPTAQSDELKKEDQEIAGVVAQLAKDSAEIDRVSEQLREQRLDADGFRTANLVSAASIAAELQALPELTEAPLGSSRDRDTAPGPPQLSGGYPPRPEQARSKALHPVVAGEDSSDEEERPRAPSAPSSAPQTQDCWSSQKELIRPFSYSASKLAGDPLKAKSFGKRSMSADKPAVPIVLSPEAVVFTGCRVGSSYEAKVELRNLSRKDISPRIMPCTNRCFSSDPLRYDKETRKKLGTTTGIIPPGVAAYLTVRFAPKTLDDQADQLVIGTDIGNIALPVQALGVQPPGLK
eukprot:TRINITY_DN24712_c0_g1_i3.p1 TRINITY_DN24712_c0_g1~~TRINITY_DN24712_c0_g1_i3.p1  ORF type:complete len:320 (+),score=64.23 TRINITY_DN24712_c0_g1_i3:17-976(+)